MYFSFPSTSHRSTNGFPIYEYWEDNPCKCLLRLRGFSDSSRNWISAVLVSIFRFFHHFVQNFRLSNRILVKLSINSLTQQIELKCLKNSGNGTNVLIDIILTWGGCCRQMYICTDILHLDPKCLEYQHGIFHESLKNILHVLDWENQQKRVCYEKCNC